MFYHLFVIQSQIREKIHKKLKENGVASGIYYPQPIHLTKPCLKLGYQEGDFPIAEKASQEALAIPIYPNLDEDQGKKIIDSINELT